jgi:hypothetical protein
VSEAPTTDGASTDPAADPNPGMLWPVGARLVSATRSMLWLAPLLGGLMLLVHFWRVGYLPALSFSELGVVLGAFGLFVAMGLVAALLLVLFPVAALFWWTASSLLPPPPKANQDDPVRRATLSRRRGVRPQKDAAVRRTFSLKVRTGMAGMLAAAAGIAYAMTLCALVYVPQLLAPRWGGSIVLALFSLGSIVLLAAAMIADTRWSMRHLRTLRRPILQFCLLLSLYLFLWPAWLWFLLTFDAFPSSPLGWIKLTMAALLIIPMVHWLWYATMRGLRGRVNLVRAVSAVFVLAYAGLAQPLLDGAASAYGFGMMHKVDLVLSARGCAIVKEALPGQACEPVPAKGDDDRRVYRLRGVDVLTCIGADYVIAPAGGIDDRALPRLALPADEVHALVRRIEMKQ